MTFLTLFSQFFACIAVLEGHGCQENFDYSHEFFSIFSNIAIYSLTVHSLSVPVDLVWNQSHLVPLQARDFLILFLQPSGHLRFLTCFPLPHFLLHLDHFPQRPQEQSSTACKSASVKISEL